MMSVEPIRGYDDGGKKLDGRKISISIKLLRSSNKLCICYLNFVMVIIMKEKLYF